MVPLPLPGPLTYALAGGMRKAPPPKGARVVVPVGRRTLVGLAWGRPARPPAGARLKAVRDCLDPEAVLPAPLDGLVEWAAGYYLYPPGLAAAEALPPGLLSARARRLDRILGRRAPLRERDPGLAAWPGGPPPEPTPAQAAVLGELDAALSRGGFAPFLLHGVTGSGKTEVYLRAAAACLARGRGVLVLVPEIAMTAQTVGRFIDRFGEAVAVLHSGLTEAERLGQWLLLRQGKRRLAVGTRSAVFAPVADLGLVVVDEEHDPSYKQDDKFRYHARDVAVMRAKLQGAAVVLGSATPSLASFRNALDERYRLLSLDHRVERRPLPEVVLVDRKAHRPPRRRPRRREAGAPPWLSPELHRALGETLERGEQALLFVNRRGFATFLFCQDCGHVFRCPRCEISLTWHKADAGPGAAKGDGRLACHYCGLTAPALPVCPQCQGHTVRAAGWGTERVAEDLAGLFPGVRVARLDRDVVRHRQDTEATLRAVRDGAVDVLVGTQMVTKGHDFPGLTLVGVLWADLSLHFPEYTAAERTFQLLAQVAGRAGRGDRPGRVVVQTWSADHYALQAATRHDFAAFFEAEMALRRALGYPPYGRLVNIRLSGADGERVAAAAARLGRAAGRLAAACRDGTEVLGPAPAPRPKLRNRFRWQLLLKGPSGAALRRIWQRVASAEAGDLPSGIRVDVDVDPQHLL
nr:primosomal protein N' [Dissulfurirhabdus thermomarina]